MYKIKAEIISSWFMQLHSDMSNQLEKSCPLLSSLNYSTVSKYSNKYQLKFLKLLKSHSMLLSTVLQFGQSSFPEICCFLF